MSDKGYDTPVYIEPFWSRLTKIKPILSAHEFDRLLSMNERQRREDREQNARIHEAERLEARWRRCVRKWSIKHGPVDVMR